MEDLCRDLSAGLAASEADRFPYAKAFDEAMDIKRSTPLSEAPSIE